MSYKIEYDIDLEKCLAKVPKKDVNAIKKKIESLWENPRTDGVVKLHGREGYRVRFGNYRIVYSIFDDKLIILIIDIGKRKDIYNKK